MAKKKEEIVEPKEIKSRKFVVLDSNGKPIREVATEEEAKELAKVYHGIGRFRFRSLASVTAT